MTRQEINDLLNEQYSEKLTLQSNLKDTDYIAAKIAEGKATQEEYADKIAERQTWRDDINAAQDEIKRLEELEPEQDDPNEE